MTLVCDIFAGSIAKGVKMEKALGKQASNGGRSLRTQHGTASVILVHRTLAALTYSTEPCPFRH